jgi:23S rRNA (guanosine2251-2'-O)-methyltransferase
MRKIENAELGRLSVEEFKSSKKIPVIIVLDNVRSLNNVGSLFRTADAFRLEAVYLCGCTGTPPNKEISKTALGATESVKWKHFATTMDCVSDLKTEKFYVCAVEQVENAISLPQFQYVAGEKLALIFGNEVYGVEQEIINACDCAIEIPQLGSKHSLNISVSAGIVLWEIMRNYFR